MTLRGGVGLKVNPLFFTKLSFTPVGLTPALLMVYTLLTHILFESE